MGICFEGTTNKNYLMVNTATFHLKDGGTITIDRKETEYEINDNALSMIWRNCYLWAINGYHVFNSEFCNLDREEMVELLKDAKVTLELEDDADEDYTVDIQEWFLCYV